MSRLIYVGLNNFLPMIGHTMRQHFTAFYAIIIIIHRSRTTIISLMNHFFYVTGVIALTTQNNCHRQVL